MVVYTPFELIDHAAGLGFEVLAITNHNLLLFNRELEKFAESREILLIPGVEATIEGRHLLLYNFMDYDPSWTTFKQVEENKGRDQLVIAPHPFYPTSTALRRRFFEWLHLIDAVEYSSLSPQFPDFNLRACKVAEQHGLPLVANSDLHFLFQLGQAYSRVRSKKSRRSVIEAIKAGRVDAIKRPGGATFLVSWLALCYVRRMQHYLGLNEVRSDGSA